jgi:hypothetical protein
MVSLGFGLTSAFSAATSVPAALMPAFVSAIGRGAVLPAGSSSPPPTCRRATLGATVPSLRMGGAEELFAPLEQTAPPSRPTSPLTDPGLVASLEWAQGSCELPTAKSRVRSPYYSAPRRLYLSARPSWSIRHSTVRPIRPPTKHLTGSHSPKRTHFGPVPSSPTNWYPPRPLPTFFNRCHRSATCRASGAASAAAWE